MFWSKRRNDSRSAEETAWRIHEAQADWTGKVDAKASFSFGIQAAVIAAVVALTADDKLFDQFNGWWVWLFVVGLLLLMAGALVAALVVAPLLRSKNLEKESERDFIYFGHLQYLEPRELERRLRDVDPIPALSRQITRMADIAWKKHVKVKWSIWLGAGGGFLLVVSGALNWFLPTS